jgi:hypothetical protein
MTTRKKAAKAKTRSKAKAKRQKPRERPAPDPRLKDPAEVRRGKPVKLDKTLGIPPGIPMSEWPENWHRQT